MAKSAHVTLRGRFRPGTVVALVEVADERVLRSEGGRHIDRKKVDENGEVRFTNRVKENGRYFIVGLIDGTPVEVRARGRTGDENAGVLEQPPVGTEVRKHADGRLVGERPERREKPEGAAVHLGQDQVPEGTPQRSDTPVGDATPIPPAEFAKLQK